MLALHDFLEEQCYFGMRAAVYALGHWLEYLHYLHRTLPEPTSLLLMAMLDDVQHRRRHPTLIQTKVRMFAELK